MTPDWYEDLAERLGEAEREAYFAGDGASAMRLRAAITAARRRARELVAGNPRVSRHVTRPLQRCEGLRRRDEF